MPDVFSKRKRSEVMSRIRGRGNRDTELALRRLFRQHGITGWRRHCEVRGTRGEGRGRKPECEAGAGSPPSTLSPRTFRVKPDFVFPKLKGAVFVDGCFWHGCPQHATRPRNNAAFWRKKLAGNKTRDRLVTRTLRRAGWRVLRIWEHELALKNEARLVGRIQRWLADRS